MSRNLALALVLLAVAAVIVGHVRRRGPRRFDSDRIAAAETRMWQAYYSGDSATLGRELVALLRGQFGLSSRNAMEVGKDLARATLAFQSLGGDYERHVLPPLERAYARLKAATDGAWDPAAAAHAELDWWVARRTPGRDSPQHVGRAIARLYTILYGESNADIERAGLLRAQAAHLRDASARAGKGCDWNEVQRILEESYRSLRQGL
ncbi:hypothetical protein AMJ85_07210 [candidate division BRC1 bacterium SM23_51]|nr:MAG: hypothetical protein AMJ85_07210 [candidate division BRC1 bacterium SM23_51]